MTTKFLTSIFKLFFSLLIFSVFIGCGDSGGSDDTQNETLPEEITGDAILDIQIMDGGDPLASDGTPPTAPEGYTLLNYDLNEGSGQNYVWLYYKLGKADGSEGEPISEIYTVNEEDGETPEGGTKVPVSLNGEGGTLWLYYIKSSWPVVRCIVVYNATEGVKVFGPPEAEDRYEIVWVEELLPDEWVAPESHGVPKDAQDLNEGRSVLSDYMYIGYGID